VGTWRIVGHEGIDDDDRACTRSRADEDVSTGGRPRASDGASMWTDLPQPRELEAAERDLLAVLVRHASCPALTEQARSVVVTGTCTCGCSSLRLRSDGPALSEYAVSRLSSTGRNDYVGVLAMAGRSADEFVHVAAHVLDGLLAELEIFAGDGIRTAPPAAGDIHSLDIV
jgi:hypothetical protein